MTRPPTIRDILGKTEAYLRDKSVDSPRLSAQLLLAKGLEMDRINLIVSLDRPLKEAELAAIRPLVARRGKGEPMAYILGEREFFGLDFLVTPDVLIPRPETELLIEEAARLFAKDAPLAVADLGCGSGCLAVTLARQFPQASVTALDLSPAALAVAARNAAKHGVVAAVSFVQGDFTVLPSAEGGYDLIVANPPYVSQAEYAELSPEVARFEPRCALVPRMPPAPGASGMSGTADLSGGAGASPASGLECYPVVAAVAQRCLKPLGVLAMEIGWKQGGAVKALLESAEIGFESVAVLKDLAGHDRVVLGRKAGPA